MGWLHKANQAPRVAWRRFRQAAAERKVAARAAGPSPAQVRRL